MEVKTNKEYQAMQKEMATAEHEVRAHEDKLLEHMELAEAFAARIEGRPKRCSRPSRPTSRGEQKALDAERA